MKEEEFNKMVESKTAYNMLKEIHREALGPTEIAERIDSSSQSVNNYLRFMLEMDIVEKKEREGRKQPYQTKTSGFSEIFLKIASEELFEGPQELHDFITDKLEEHSGREALKEEFDKEFPTLLGYFVDNYLSIRIEKAENIKEVVFDIFLDGVETIKLEDKNVDVPEWLIAVKKLSDKRNKTVVSPELVLRSSIQSFNGGGTPSLVVSFSKLLENLEKESSD